VYAGLSYPSACPPQEPLERLSGSIERVTFHSEESGFCVLRVKVKVKVKGERDLLTVLGTAAAVAPGEYLEAFGHWVNDRNPSL
jgi:exodeoxyribonuclease V alpha subunit